jgi:hypothetical protein
MMNMKHTGKLVTASALIALLATPASARIEGDEGGSAAYPFRDYQGRGMWGFPNHVLVNRPPQAR